MSQTPQEVDKSLNQFSEQVLALEVGLLALIAELAQQGHTTQLPRALSAVNHLDRARDLLVDRIRDSGAEGSTGQIDPPPVDHGGLGRGPT